MDPIGILERIRKLPPDERRGLIEQILEEFGDPREPELTLEQVEELEWRADEALAHPDRCRPFDQAFREAEARFITNAGEIKARAIRRKFSE